MLQPFIGVMAVMTGCADGPVHKHLPPGSGPQVDSSPGIEAVARQLAKTADQNRDWNSDWDFGQSPDQSLDHRPGAVANYVVTNFRYNNRLKPQSMSRRASALFDNGELAGCADYAVVATALLRAAGIPSRLVLSVNRDWVAARRSHPFLVPRGHVFIEVQVDGDWRLLDVAYLKLYQDYSPDDPVLPHGERYCLRTIDFWQAGIASPEALITGLNRCADRLPDETGPARTLTATPL
jgi:hypothetical protein